MRVPLSWLKEYVDIEIPVEELARRLTLAGVEVSQVLREVGPWHNIFVGRVVEVRPHPNAERLKVAVVDLGTDCVTSVCGAPNVAQGQKVALARPGASLFNPHSGQQEVLRPARIRGVLSEGMICSEKELGIGEDHTGILVLPEDSPVGVPLSQILGDPVLELEVTPNRPDCLSVLGVAREVAALTQRTVREPQLTYPEEGDPIESRVSVEIADPHLCFRYTAALITGVHIAPSPPWLQERLERAGMRPINNVVDITNYVMLEYGQPIHAFDFHTIGEGKILVRQARQGERLVTLDGVERFLEPPILVIADAHRAVALGGVMGGLDTEVTDTTTDILLESATFDPVNTRRTAQRLKIRTEASLRFEKGLQAALAPLALRRATRLILHIAGGKAAPGIIDVYPLRREAPVITLTRKRVQQVLGLEVPMEQMERVLSSLGIFISREDEEALRATVPYWRSDLTGEDDLVEEIARILGYEAIPTIPLSGAVPQYQPQAFRQFRERVRDFLVAWGLQETISYSLTSLAVLEKAKALSLPSPPGTETAAERLEPLRVANPMSPQQEYLRTSLRGSLLLTLARNERHQEGLRLFEMGKVYLPRKDDLPEEREMLVALFSGTRGELSWLGRKEKVDFFDAKGVLEALFRELGLSPEFLPHGDPMFHPTRCAQVTLGQGQHLGLLGEVHPQVLEAFDIHSRPVILFELDMEALFKGLPEGGKKYRPLPRFPAAVRDLAVVLDEKVPAATVQRLIEEHPLVSQALLFDCYSGDPVPKGKKSLAYRVSFQLPERTLTHEEVNRAQKEILEALQREVGATLRS